MILILIVFNPNINNAQDEDIDSGVTIGNEILNLASSVQLIQSQIDSINTLIIEQDEQLGIINNDLMEVQKSIASINLVDDSINSTNTLIAKITNEISSRNQEIIDGDNSIDSKRILDSLKDVLIEYRIIKSALLQDKKTKTEIFSNQEEQLKIEQSKVNTTLSKLKNFRDKKIIERKDKNEKIIELFNKHNGFTLEIVQSLTQATKTAAIEKQRFDTTVVFLNRQISKGIGLIENLSDTIDFYKDRQSILEGIGVYVGGGFVYNPSSNVNRFELIQRRDSVVLNMNGRNRLSGQANIDVVIPVWERWALLAGINLFQSQNRGSVDGAEIGVGWMPTKKFPLYIAFGLSFVGNEKLKGEYKLNGKRITSNEAYNYLKSGLNLAVQDGVNIENYVDRDFEPAFFLSFLIPVGILNNINANFQK